MLGKKKFFGGLFFAPEVNPKVNPEGAGAVRLLRSRRRIFLFFIVLCFVVCTAAGHKMEDGLCLDPNRPRRYVAQQPDTTITTMGTMIKMQARGSTAKF